MDRRPAPVTLPADGAGWARGGLPTGPTTGIRTIHGQGVRNLLERLAGDRPA